MRVIQLSVSGEVPVRPSIYKQANGQEAYQFTHGESGRGRWQVRLPLGLKSFPFNGEDGKPSEAQEYKLVKLEGKKDPRENQLYLLGEGSADETCLVLWSLSPGFRGSASFQIEANAELLASGMEAQGDAGRMGGASCPIVLARKGAVLKWQRSGRLYGRPASWIARFDGQTWTVSTETAADLQSAVEQV